MLDRIWPSRRIPLAFLLLTRQPARLAVALAGIAFAGILMFMQLGFRDGLFEASVTVHQQFDADLVLISPRTMSSIGMAAFPRRRLVQAMADPAVAGTADLSAFCCCFCCCFTAAAAARICSARFSASRAASAARTASWAAACLESE